jgi:adenylate cyclase
MHFRVSGLYVLLVCSLLATATAVRWADPFFVRALRLIAFDGFQRLDPRPYDPELPVRIVDIDEKSLELYGQWPWPRTILRDLVARLAERDAAAIAFDILFSEPDRSSLEEVVKKLPADQAALLVDVAARTVGNDRAFADALAGSPAVLAIVLTNGTLAAFEPKPGFAVAGDDPRGFVTAFAGATGNLAMLDQAARGIGAINWTPDRDQVVRHASLIYRLGNGFVPSLAAEALRVAQNATTYVLKSSNASGESAFGKSTGLNHIGIGDLEIPTDADGGLTLRFRPSEPQAFIPAWKVLSGKVSREEIAGRIILVGSSAPGLFDVKATPLDAAIPGVEIHAQLIEQILTNSYLRRPDYALALEQFIIIALGVALAVVLPHISARTSALVGLVTVGGILFGGWAAYTYWGLLFDPLFPALALGCFIMATTFYVYRRVEAQRGEIRFAFGRYLAPAVVEQLIADPDRLVLGGEIRDITLMFCDVRNFTSISEQLTAAELTNFINELLTPLTGIILQNKGTIDKFMGDAIMSFWNAPLDDPDHAIHACRSAIAMTAKMEELNRIWNARASAAHRPFDPVRIGIGINSGNCCVGNLGSTQRFDYSAIGDDVNVTSRLEGLSKVYGVTVVVSEQTIARTPFAALELDAVRVKGRRRATRLFTLVELLHDDRARRDSLRPIHAQFLEAYRCQCWVEAEVLIAKCREIGVAQLETYYAMFASRIELLRQTTLPSDWDGAFEMTEK